MASLKLLSLNEDEKPPLAAIINTHDFEEVARKTIPKKAWAFYSSAATDQITRNFNESSYDRIFFRPRILRNVTNVNIEVKMLGQKMALPLFVAPAAMAKMIHPDGEKALARAAASRGIIQCVSNHASFPLTEIIPQLPKGYPVFFQLYVNRDREKSEELLKKVTALGSVKAIFVTVDAPVVGKREEDEKIEVDESLTTPMGDSKVKNDDKGGGLGRAIGYYVDSSLTWEDIPWLRSLTNIPIVLKGIQTAADAKMALECGVDAIILSNHGGRSLDTYASLFIPQIWKGQGKL
ncbi:hypothetical protein GP486_000760 [Trichoglossum hirsutum]|uniref:FMN hydroxy acid dehydrogenase domain-containing protein n=1 Tax=Trichoglossum hirsutum TaxID=265104 RepID=A0A9P8LIB6_9PEZI|nr:hypothetical protein GP486_000760 [Trichoglossum hirsutum]